MAEPAIPPSPLRALARIIDMAAHIAVMEMAGRLARYLPDQGLVTLPDDMLLWVDGGVGLGAFVLATAIGERFGGATFGKLCTGLRAVGEDGTPLGTGAAVKRNVAFFLDSFLFGLVAYSTMARSETNQRVGDYWAKTVVVWRGEAPVPWGWALGLLASFGMVMLSYVVVR